MEKQIILYAGVVLFFMIAKVYFDYKKQKDHLAEIEKMDINKKKIEIEKLKLGLDKYKTNHVLHFLITVLSIGCWVIVWALVSMNNSSNRRQIEGLIKGI